jgi:hypothetical protein
MPGYDGTGPASCGTMTGRGQGVCITDDPVKTERFLAWRGRGLGWGLGRGAGGGRRGGRGFGMRRGCRS